MTIRKFFFHSLAVLLFTPVVALAAICTSTSAGRWDQPARWDCGHVPLTTDTVVIAHNNVQMRGNYTVAGLTINIGSVQDGFDGRRDVVASISGERHGCLYAIDDGDFKSAEHFLRAETDR